MGFKRRDRTKIEFFIKKIIRKKRGLTLPLLLHNKVDNSSNNN